MATTEGRHSVTTHPVTTPRATMSRPVDYVWAITRISLGWIFLWAFLPVGRWAPECF
jgi:thiosulfate dehydrogenase [quinone] large subunit